MAEYGLRGRTVLVTGGNTGIGAATVRVFAAEGARVGLAYFEKPERAEALVDEVRAGGGRAAAFEADLADAAVIPRLLDQVETALGPMTVLVNNAAHSTSDGYEALSAATLDRHYFVNARATGLLTAELGRRFEGEWGRVVNLTSGQSLGAMPGELAYVASKGAIEALTRTLALELAPRGITVNAVDPGATDTGWMSTELRAQMLRRAPFGRLGTPEDAARLILFLSSAQAGWITGQVIHSRGGM
jgi:3-oxoacyl-[acyl-carrier protein] reductase